jgi:hypothetical protein
MRFVKLRSLPMIGCHSAKAWLSEYLEPDPDLTESEHRFMHLHLARCRRCRRMLEQLKATITQLGELRVVEPAPPGIAERIEKRLRGELDP